MRTSGAGYVMLGKQASKGTPVSPTIAIQYLNDGAEINHEVVELRFGQDDDYRADSVKMKHTEKFSFSVYARPKIAAYLCGYILGDATIAGAGDPRTHVLTRDERPWLTIDRQLDSTFIHRMYDCKLEKVSISADAGKPLKLQFSGQAVNSVLRTTAATPTYDTEKPFSFYHGAGRFKYNTTADDYIKSFSIDMEVNSGGGLLDDQYQIEDLPDFTVNVSASAEYYNQNMNRWKSVNYSASTIPQETITTASFEIDCQYAITTTRQLKITIPEMYIQPVTGINLSPDNNTLIESVAGIAQKQATTELVTVTCKNSISTTIA